MVYASLSLKRSIKTYYFKKGVGGQAAVEREVKVYLLYWIKIKLAFLKDRKANCSNLPTVSVE